MTTAFDSLRRRTPALALFAVLTCPLPASAGEHRVEVKAKGGATVQIKGPRSGEPGARYFNVEGKANGEDGKYASFGVLDFPLPRPDSPATRVTGLTLTLVQSHARFSKDGPIRVALATGEAKAITPEGPLKFDAAVSGGVGKQLDPLQPLGEAVFKKQEKGTADTLTLKPTPEAEAHLRDRLNAGGAVRLVVLPAGDDVAATYQGVTADDEVERPKLTVVFETAATP